MDQPSDAELRRVAFAMAYRMLGSVDEAEDVVQESLLRLHQAGARGEDVQSPRAYLATVATRLSIDHLRSARVRRETYAGEWLPEPLVTDDGDDPARRAEMADSLSLAFLTLLESLTPEQRAVLLLRDVFDYGYDEISRVVGTSESNARQLAVRARRRVTEGRPRFRSSREEREALATRFFAAAQAGDLAGLEALLADDVELHGDGGGRVPALARSIGGRTRVARTLRAWWRHAPAAGGVTLRRVEVNGEPGAMMLDGEGRVLSVMALAIDGGRIRSINSVVNPDKLDHLGPVGDVRALLRRDG